MPGTVQFHRVLTAPPERVYRAFLDPEALVKWLPPHGFTATVHHSDPRVGGSYKMSFTNFSSKKIQSFGGEYLELVPRRAPPLDGSLRRPEPAGRNEQHGDAEEGLGGHRGAHRAGRIPDAIPAEACVLGWQESLTLLAQLVQPEIPD